MSMREGLTLANLLGCNNVIMKSHSHETVEASSGGEACGMNLQLCLLIVLI
jgi:hypothetical protein